MQWKLGGHRGRATPPMVAAIPHARRMPIYLILTKWSNKYVESKKCGYEQNRSRNVSRHDKEMFLSMKI